MVSMLGPSHQVGDIFIPKYANIEDNLQQLESFIPRSDDYLLCSYPKSGTHWVNEIMRMLISGDTTYNCQPICNLESGNYDFSSSPDTTISAPRVLHTHLPCQMLPHSILRRKMVYVMRNPRDQIVSLYHHHQGLKWSPTLTFEEFFHQVLGNPQKVEYGDWFSNAYQWWLRYHNADNVLFLFYEDLIFDLEREIAKLVNFYNLSHLTPEFIKEVAFKTKLAQLKNKPVGEWFTEWHKESFSIYRKGEIGNWQMFFTEEMNEMFDEFCQRMAGNAPYPANYSPKVYVDNRRTTATNTEICLKPRPQEMTLLEAH